MYKVLIADDEIMIRRGLSKIIRWEQIGFELAGVAQNSREALDILQNTRVDVLLTDISMPEISGLELIRMAKELRPGIKTVVISGYSEFDYAVEAIKLKVENYILKPLDPNNITEIFERLKMSLDQERENQQKELYLKSEYELICRRDFRKNEYQDSFLTELIQIMEEGRHTDTKDYINRLFRMLSGNDQINPWEYCTKLLRNAGVYFHVEHVPLFKLYRLEKNPDFQYSLKEIERGFAQDLSLLAELLRQNSESTAILVSQQAREYIDNHYSDKELSLKQVAQLLGVSYGYLSTAFNKTFDENFKAYLVSVRIEKARELLMERKYKIYEIADKVGYSSSRYFTDAFKRRYGLSPVDYLNRLNQGK